MNPADNSILVINSGSSSIKFSLYKNENTLEQLVYGEIVNIGAPGSVLNHTNTITGEKSAITIDRDAGRSPFILLDWLEKLEGINYGMPRMDT